MPQEQRKFSYKEFEDQWNEPHEQHSKEHIRSKWQIMKPHIIGKKNNRAVFYLSSVAVVIALVISSVFLMKYFAPEPSSTTNETMAMTWIENTEVQTKKITLPDGTEVFLEKSAKIGYSEGFSNGREIQLEGNAFLDVAKDQNKPFSIHQKNYQAKVLGTSFYWKSKDNSLTVNLVEGSLEVSDKTTGQSKILNAGETYQSHAGKQASVSTLFEKNGDEVSFQGADLPAILGYLKEYRGISYSIQKPIQPQSITLMISPNDSNEQIVAYLRVLTQLSLEYNDQELIVNP